MNIDQMLTTAARLRPSYPDKIIIFEEAGNFASVGQDAERILSALPPEPPVEATEPNGLKLVTFTMRNCYRVLTGIMATGARPVIVAPARR